MRDDIPHRGRGSLLPTSLAAYHEPPNASMQSASPRGDSFEAQPSLHMASTSASDVARHTLYPSHLLGSFPPTLQQPVRRRVMYDPVRDSVASSSPATSSIRTAPICAPEPEDRKPLPPINSIIPGASTSHPTVTVNPKASSYDEVNAVSSGVFAAVDIANWSDCVPFCAEPACATSFPKSKHIRSGNVRQLSQHPESLATEDHPPQSPRLSGDNSHIPVNDRIEPSAVSGSNADDELGAAERSNVAVPFGHKRDGRDVEYDDVEHYRNYVPKLPSVDKGKGKAVEQAPAFRLDNLLSDSSSHEPYPKTTAEDYDLYHSESYTERAPSESYTFTGKLPPPPHIGSSTPAPTPATAPTPSGPADAHTTIPYLGITVSTQVIFLAGLIYHSDSFVHSDVDLSRFLSTDDFEKSVRVNPGPFTEFSLSALAGEMPSNAKRARKHGPSSQRRKARGLFPQDNVPLAISTTTSKQSRYRPSGDRQPVACGYKDPITQIQCDEPFNRSVELRRHVRAVHVPAEALAVTMGQLAREQATLLPADWKPGDGDVLRPKCLCGKEFSRLDALRRHWTGVQAEVVDGKCISCPSSLAKKKDHTAFEQGTESTYGAPLYS